MIQKFKENWQREEVRSISRRYFISNGFDGTLGATGVTVGSFLSSVPDGLTVFKVGLGAGIGLASSGVWSVWEIEKAEKLAQIHDLEESVMEDLEDTQMHEQKKQGRIINALSSGLGSVIGVLMPIKPFLLEGTLLTMRNATFSSVVLAVTSWCIRSIYGQYFPAEMVQGSSKDGSCRTGGSFTEHLATRVEDTKFLGSKERYGGRKLSRISSR